MGPLTPMGTLLEGRVLRLDAKVCHVDIGDRVVLAAPRGSLFEHLEGVKNPITVGDQVLFDPAGDPVHIHEVLPRRNHLSRVASSHDPREQVLFANVDQLLCFGSIKKPKFSSNRADRILAACLYHEIPATLVLNKIDLDRKGFAAEIVATYRAAGVPVLQTSVETGEGVEAVAELLRGKTTALYGASGVGKSSMLNRIEPSLNLKIGHISSRWAQGRHTTSFSQLHPIPALDAWIVDTPGIRVFRLHDVNTAELRDLFPEFAPYATRCHFPDCTHVHEPDCAVIDAVEAEDLSVNRFASYIEMHDEAQPPPDYIPEAEPETDPEPETPT